MNRIKTLDDLEKIREQALLTRKLEAGSGQIQVIVDMGTPAIAAGAQETLKAIVKFIADNGLRNISIRKTSNVGFDSLEPIVQIVRENEPKISYGKVSPEVANRILAEHAVGGKIVSEYQINH
jgi:NADP-reducing hydrogenase subunit HndB